MVRRSSILASDADRERVAERLTQAATEGRILAHELDERLGRALRARTYGELDELIADLPRGTAPDRRRSRSLSLARSHPVATVAVLVAVTLVLFVIAAALAMFAFSGVWVVFLIFALVNRGRFSGARRGYARYPRVGYGPQRGRYPYWVR